MKIIRSEFDLSSLIISPEQIAPRTPGNHVSSIIKTMAMAMGKRDGDFTEEQLGRFATLGRLWEVQLSNALFKEPRYVRPGEVERDGIIGSPDCVDTEEWLVQEFKVTWVSYRDFESKLKFTEYLWQVKSYCYMLGMVRAHLIVLFVCGNWREDPVPRPQQWSLLFTAQELQEHWRAMLTNRRTEHEK